MKPHVIIGAGPAGLSAAYTLTKAGEMPLVIESRGIVGGIARTESFQGQLFDIGGHRFLTQEGRVFAFWKDVLGDDFLEIERLSRIFYNGKIFRYPIELTDALQKLGLLEGIKILGSLIWSQIRKKKPEHTFEDWVCNRFGDRLFRIFFKEYTEKVWGVDCRSISAEWASQRIQNLTLISAILDSIFSQKNIRSLTRRFHYPRRGPGMLWTRVAELIKKSGAELMLDSSVSEIHVENKRAVSVMFHSGSICQTVAVSSVIATMPLANLVRSIRPEPPECVLRAASQLTHRSLIVVGLIINRAHLFSDQWLYIHSPDFKVGRIQNFKNWSVEMVSDPNITTLGLEYFCSIEDPLWKCSNEKLIDLARDEVAGLGIASKKDVREGVVFREAFAYPVYSHDYEKHVATIRDYIDGISNLRTVGRSAMHRYNNQDHSMLAGIFAAENIFGQSHDLWNVNTAQVYYEKNCLGNSAHIEAT